MDKLIVIGFYLIIQALLVWWVQARIKYSINHKCNVELEKTKRNQLQKDKAAIVSEFLAEWTHVSDGNTKRLNQLLWELSLYLPTNLVHDSKSRISGGYGKTAPEILDAIRNHLLENSDPIKHYDITNFSYHGNSSMVLNLNHPSSETR